MLQTGENVSEQEEIVSMCKELEDTGALVAILFDNVTAYSTPGYTLEAVSYTHLMCIRDSTTF